MAAFLAVPVTASSGPPGPAALPTWGALARLPAAPTPEAASESSSALGLAFTAAALGAMAGMRRSRHGLRALPGEKQEPSSVSRAELLRGLGSCSLLASPKAALAKSKQEAFDELTSYGMADIAPTQDPPGGWSWVVEGIGLTADAYNGKFKSGGEPQVVRFLSPPFWTLTRPAVDYNGASGTVQINDYNKGDAATIFVDTKFTGKLEEMKKEDYNKEIFKALTQKGKAFVTEIKIDKVSDGDAPGYKIVEYSYTLASGAGFEIDRNGIAAVSQVSDNGYLQIFWGGVLTSRWQEGKDTLEKIVRSYRIAKVPEGVKIEQRKEFKAFGTDFREERKGFNL